MSAVAERIAGYEALQEAVARAAAEGAKVRLRKDTSNLFRARTPDIAVELDVRQCNRVIRIDPGRRLAEVEGMLTYEDFVAATLPYELAPAVVPELKTITVGGAVAGLGVESSSLHYGLAHETVEAMDLLLGDGSIAGCSRDANSDLFFGFPNSYGSLGYALRLTVRLIPAAPYVRLTHRLFRDPRGFFAALLRSEADYTDGTVFAPNEMYVTEGWFAAAAPYTSDYTGRRIYYRSILERREDFLTARDYLWRWDTDWFWCSRQFHLQNPLLRWLARRRLGSRHYQRWMRLAARWLPDTGRRESVIQDVQIPRRRAAGFFEFLMREVPILPVWVCPFRTSADRWPLTALEPGHDYVNFGFWDVVAAQGPPGFLNRRIERRVREEGGTKGLYAASFYEETEFWSLYDRQAYLQLKARADPRGVFRDLYASTRVG